MTRMATHDTDCGQPVIALDNITKRFRMQKSELAPDGTYTALDGVSFCVRQGECAVIGGANGSGKSLLMSIIAGLTEPTAGVVRVSQRVGLVFQDADTQILGETPREDVAFGPANLKLPKELIARRVQDALAAVELTEKADFPARTLSGGEKRRLAAAGILAVDAPVFIFDEPYANLDYAGVKQVNALITALRRDGKTVLILTHELEKCLALAQRFLVLHRGTLVFDGTPEEGLTQPLESWSIRNPLHSYARLQDLLWN